MDKKINKKLFKIRFPVILLILILQLIAIIFISLQNDDFNLDYRAALDANQLIISGLDFGYLNKDGSFMEIKSDLAYADMSSNHLKLEDIKINYDNNKITVTANAARGSYELNKIFSAEGNLNGNLNDLSFISKPEGRIVYDYDTGKGKIINGLELKQDMNKILSDTVFFDSKADYFLFNDNVKVFYNPRVVE